VLTEHDRERPAKADDQPATNAKSPHPRIGVTKREGRPST
jgi:hypothetical protein